MGERLDVVALGELLVDFTPAGSSEKGMPLYEQNPGGAPANLLACLAKLGRTTSFIGKVGDDHFGRFLRDVLLNQSIGVAGLVLSPVEPTTLAFVHLDICGERSFTFYRNHGADTTLHPDELSYNLISQAKIFHFGSLSLTHQPAHAATLAAVEYARKTGALISCDPNLRPALWDSLDHAKTTILSVLKQVDLLKVSQKELEFLTGQRGLVDGTSWLQERYNLQLILVTLGPEGCFLRRNDIGRQIPGFRVRPVDTTGAGDAFWGGYLGEILRRGTEISSWVETELTESARFANAVGALATTARGGIPAIPEMEQVYALIQRDS